jgi:hypothetical protein
MRKEEHHVPQEQKINHGFTRMDTDFYHEKNEAHEGKNGSRKQRIFNNEETKQRRRLSESAA